MCFFSSFFIVILLFLILFLYPHCFYSSVLHYYHSSLLCFKVYLLTSLHSFFIYIIFPFLLSFKFSFCTSSLLDIRFTFLYVIHFNFLLPYNVITNQFRYRFYPSIYSIIHSSVSFFKRTITFLIKSFALFSSSQIFSSVLPTRNSSNTYYMWKRCAVRSFIYSQFSYNIFDLPVVSWLFPLTLTIMHVIKKHCCC